MSMAAKPEDQVPLASPIDPGTAARRLVRSALKASLATLDRDTGHPYPSLVLVATEPDGSPVLLISRLAQHTRNLEADARAAILFDGTDGLGDPLTGGRVTVSGNVRPTSSPTALPRFLARHASAQGYAAFPDFSAYALTISKAHFIGGFGRIVGLDAPALITPVAGADALINGEADIVAHMNEDHSDAVALYATQLAGCEPGEWRMVGIDPGGCDLLHRTNAARIDFPAPVHSPGEARAALVALVKEARARIGQTA
jgi:putative heme iron utilization protein